MQSSVSERVAAILLAAGESTRMVEPKQLLEWKGVPLIQYQVKQLCDTPAQEIVVVLGHKAEEFLPLVEHLGGPPRVRSVVNPDYAVGKTTSIKAGLSGLQWGPMAVMLLAVDQPRPGWLLRRLLEEHLQKRNIISVPSYRGKHGHPPVFDGSLIPELMAISEERQGIREVIERHREELRDVPVEAPIALSNLNTLEDYRRARKLAG